MALITCRECQKQISTEAKQCPNCGAKVIPYKLPKKKISGTSIMKGLLVGFAVLVALSTIGAFIESQKSPEQLQQEAANREAYNKRQTEIKQEKEKKTLRENRAATVAAAIRLSARNPDTIRWESILTNEDATVVCVTAGLENGFGGMNRENIAAVGGQFSNKVKDWNKHCAEKRLFDVTSIASRMQKYMD
jgi:rRNA maturation endonuclease Nob1